jgi:hypothetical protein
MKKICREPGHVHSRSEKSECYWVYSALSHFSYSIFNILRDFISVLFSTLECSQRVQLHVFRTVLLLILHFADTCALLLPSAGLTLSL